MRLIFKSNEEKYWEDIRNLRNNPIVREGFIDQHIITEEEQKVYMKKYNDNFWICLLDDDTFLEPKFCGYVGVIDRDIRIAVLPGFQKRGIAKFMIRELMKIKPDSFAKIKIDNKASLNLFLSCGFKIKYFLLEKDECH